MLGLYRFHWDCGRMGEIYGLFYATGEEINDALNQELYLGEILGKHSDVHGVIESEDLELITNDPSTIEVLQNHNLTLGINPLEYLEEPD